MKRIAGCFCFILLCSLSAASAQHRAEFIIGAGGGAASYIFSAETGKGQLGFSAGGDLSFAIMFNKYVGIRIGGGVSYDNTGFNISNIKGKSELLDYNKDSCRFSYEIDNLMEKMSLINGAVPVMLCMQFGGKAAVYLAFGAKVGIPIKATSLRHIDHLYAEVYYYPFDVTVNEPLFVGLGDFYGGLPREDVASLPDLKTKIKVGLSVNVAAEVGVKLRMKERGYFYLLLFAEYGVLNTINKNRQLQDPVAWNGTTTGFFKRNSVSLLNGQTLNNNGEIVPIIKKMNPLVFGLKIAFGIGMGANLE
jgi:hypothetical protein